MIIKSLLKTVGSSFSWKLINCRHYSIGLSSIMLGCLIFALTSPCRALTTVSQGYMSSSQLNVGSIVSLQKNTSDTINAATLSNANNILGVVINSGSSLLSVSVGQTSQAQVATSGIVPVYVSNINGSIGQGAPITASPIAGVGMLATSNVKVVGIAQGNLNANNSHPESYTDKTGEKHSVVIGQIPVTVNVSYFYKQPVKTIIPSALQNIFDDLAGKPVNSLPILISLGIFIVTLIITVSIIYSMIRNSIISVGRNPMAQAAVYRDLLQMSALVVGILVVAAIAIYLIITRL